MNEFPALFEINKDGASGVYILWLGDDCVYVGQTANIFLRMSDHWKRNFDRITFIPVLHWGPRLTLEETLIKKLKPQWNIQLVGGRLSEDRRCKPHGARGRDISGDRFATHRLLMNVAIEKTGTQKRLAEILEVEPRAISHWRRTGDIPVDQKPKVEAFIGMSVDAIATFIAESGAPDKWQKREYFNGDFEEEAA